jgi:hypothetical protein
MAIMDDIRRMMAERAAQGIGTDGGIFGTTNQQGQPMGLLGGMRNINPNLLIGASIAGAGLQGKDPFSSILPAVAQTAQISKYLTPKTSKPFEVINKQTGKPELITNAQYAANPQLYEPAKKTPLMAAGETEEQKEIGKAFGKKFTDINTAAESAQKNMGNLQTIETLIQQPNLKTGFLGEFRTSASKLANEFGFDFDIQNTPAAEVLSTTTGALVLEGLSNFKGAISDGERQFVKDINPGLNMSKEGIAANIALQKKGNEITLKYNEEANDWVERNGGLSKKDKLTGDSWSTFTTKFNKENPLISDDERKMLNNLSKSYDQEFLEGGNVQEIKGVKYIEIGGNIYKLD